jgi:zinc/manganese transport system substrate-binding protein
VAIVVEPGNIRTALLGGLLVGLALAGAGCGATKSRTGAPSGALQVVAAENFWGSIASQLGGNRVHVTSVITNPATDPHDYEPTAADARTIAGSRMVIVNGIGYDPWAEKLISSNPVSGRVVLDVGDLVGIERGGNPHRWYSPANVQQTIDAIVRDYSKLEPKDTGYFGDRKTLFETHGLARYRHLIATIKRQYRGVPVSASESIFVPLARALGLRLLTPPSFLKAVSEGTEPTAADKTTIDRQIAGEQIKVWVYNSQNSTPDVKRITEAARKRGIPIATVTETPVPGSASFQAWQSRQLQSLAAALAQATGR